MKKVNLESVSTEDLVKEINKRAAVAIEGKEAKRLATQQALGNLGKVGIDCCLILSTWMCDGKTYYNFDGIGNSFAKAQMARTYYEMNEPMPEEPTFDDFGGEEGQELA